MAALHILLSSSAMREQLRSRQDRGQETNVTPGPSNRRPSTLGNRRGSDATFGGSRPGTHMTSVSRQGVGDVLNPEVALGSMLGKLVLTAVRMLGTDSIKAQSSAAAVIADLSMDDYARGVIIASGAVLHLLNCLDQGSPQACIALLSLRFSSKTLNPEPFSLRFSSIAPRNSLDSLFLDAVIDSPPPSLALPHLSSRPILAFLLCQSS
jgi:hypothetical protein